MGLEGGDGIAESVPTCFSFVQGPGTDLGNPTWGPTRRYYFGEAVIAIFSEEWETSYRQFLETHAPGEGRVIGLGEGANANFWRGFPQGEGSYRRFFGRESSLFLIACRLSRAQEHFCKI